MLTEICFFIIIIFRELSFRTSQNKESQRRAVIRGLTTGCIFSLQLDEPITRRVGRVGRSCERGPYICYRSFTQHTQNNFDMDSGDDNKHEE